ncbi:N-acetylmuramoyl-L-alanine amidase [uncultured Desulfuromusa sp.]|uniref:N-acetylmuramoyl-L-alanine amidase n=1 Tax=uncultured Desulfuromusa sp. TaxID=219183 RepID=UPI002AA94C56|nr:N-acetylmuramoyl-L-alanine amidase [uncultured Desulfuromusa sp.]
MKYRNAFIFIILLLLLAILPCSVFAESYSALRQEYQKLMQSSQLQRQRNNWDKLIAGFDRFVVQQPQNKDIDRALFLKARLWDGLSRASGSSKDALEAIDQYKVMAERFPDSRLADDALFLAAQIAENKLKNKSSAYRLYQQLIVQMPKGDMVAEAQKRIAKLPAPKVQQPVVAEVGHADYRMVGDAPRLVKIRYWSGPEYTRVVLDLSAPVVAKPNYLKGENPRLYFDLLYTKVVNGLPATIAIGNGLVRQVRASQFDEQRTRVVLDLNRVAEYKLVTLENPHRLVIDIKGQPAGVALSTQPPGRQDAPIAADDSIASILNSSSDRQVAVHIPREEHDEGIRLVVVDAGHGGRDPGAIGPNNTYEKDVTLAMAKVLAKRLRQQLGVKVLLTRSDDRYLKLRERTEYANQVGADLFISLHANATANGKASGIETYFLNLSKNNQAAEVAARENGTSLQEVGNLEAILFDLMANAKINESSRLAAEVQQSLVSGLRSHYSRVKDHGVKQGPFHVLLGATMPSVLIEAGFISNSRDEKRLASANYQKHVASAIVAGVESYSSTIGQVAKR